MPAEKSTQIGQVIPDRYWRKGALLEIALIKKEEIIPRNARRPLGRGSKSQRGIARRRGAATSSHMRRSDRAGGAGAYGRLESQVSVFLMPRGECSQIAWARGAREALALIRHHYMILPLSVNFSLSQSDPNKHPIAMGKPAETGWFSWSHRSLSGYQVLRQFGLE
jgi:hypothetical protein